MELEIIERKLADILPKEDEEPKSLHKAMRYSVLSGGKRIRPILALTIASALKRDPEELLIPACAIELVHTATLIIDDLPCQDDDKTRRGKPCCHIEFGESTAILAAISIFSLASEIISKEENIIPEKRTEIIRIISESLGSIGLCAGQELDVSSKNADLTKEKILEIYELKTVSLFLCIIRCVIILLEPEKEDSEKIIEFTHTLALAFQLKDDLMEYNEEGIYDEVNILKVQSLEETEKMVDELYQKADNIMEGTGFYSEELRKLAKFIVYRKI